MYAVKYGHVDAVKCMLATGAVKLDICTRVRLCSCSGVGTSVDDNPLHSLAEKNECAARCSVLPATELLEGNSHRAWIKSSISDQEQ